MSEGQGKGPFYTLNIEGTKHDWDSDTIVMEQIAELGDWDPSLGVDQIDLRTQEKRSLAPGEIVELKPGMGFARKFLWKRGLNRSRLEAELDLMRNCFPDIEYVPDGHWFLIPCYPVPPGWSPAPPDVVFQAQPGHPGQKPYGIYVASSLRFQGQPPDNFKPNAKHSPPFPGSWGILSWSPQQWDPASNVSKGSNLLHFALSFRDRFEEGI